MYQIRCRGVLLRKIMLKQHIEASGYVTPPRNLKEFLANPLKQYLFPIWPICYECLQLVQHSKCLITNKTDSSLSDYQLLERLEESVILILVHGNTGDEVARALAECSCLVDKLVLATESSLLFDEDEWVHVVLICLFQVFLSRKFHDGNAEKIKDIWHEYVFCSYCTKAQLEAARQAVVILLNGDTDVCEHLVKEKLKLILGSLEGFN